MNPFERPLSLYPCEIDIKPEHQTRLLELLPGSGNEEIVCQVSAHTLKDETSEASSSHFNYEALSYVWGRWDTAATIQVNGVSDFPITYNLLNALRRLRREAKPRRLWIDQICINQQDHHERKKQVRQMGRIFSQADRVIVWFGDNDEKISTTEAENKLKKHEALKHAIKNKSVDPWWTRAWVIEEYALARETPLVMFGPYTMEWSDMLKVANDHMMPFDSFGEFLGQMTQFDTLRPKKDGTRPDTSLFSMSVVLKDTDTSDPRDKVFCVLPSLPKQERDLIIPWQQGTISEVFTQASFTSMSATSSLGILSLVTRLSNPNKKQHGLPSWAVDFTFPDKKQTIRGFHPSEGGWIEKLNDRGFGLFQKLQMELQFSTYSFDKLPKSWTRRNPRTTAVVQQNPLDLRELHLTGMEFDTLQDVVAVDDSFTSMTKSPGSSTIQSWIRYISPTTANSGVSWIDSKSFNKQEREVISCLDKRLEHCSNPYMLLDAMDDQKISEPILPPYSSPSSSKPRKFRGIMLTAMFRKWDAAARPGEAPSIFEFSFERLGKIFWDIKKAEWSGAKESRPGWHEGAEEGMITAVFKMFLYADSRGMAFFITTAGFIGVGPADLKSDDKIILPYGSSFPIALRRSPNGKWLFVGFCYVRGIMNQELWNCFQDICLKEETYIIE